MIELLSFGDSGWGDEMLQGAGMTVLVALLSFGLGLPIGLAGAGAKLSRSLPLRLAADIYTTVVRGIPELLVIFLLFFGLERAILSIAAALGLGGTFRLNNFVIGTAAVALISGAYSTEVLRGAIRAIPAGQIEAGRAFGMSRRTLFRRIVLPQMIRYAVPGLGNVWQLTLKDTALVSVTALAELMRMASVAARSTRQPFTFYLAAACIYLLLTVASQAVFQRVERRSLRGVRRG